MNGDQRRRVYDGFCKVDGVTTDGVEREVVVTTDAVALLVYIPAWEKIVLVRQTRAPMTSDDNPEGYLDEVLAGRCDKDISVKELMAAEAYEEAGITIDDPHDIEIINGGTPLASSPGALTERIHLGYVMVAPHQVAQGTEHFGAEDEHEKTLRLLIPVANLEEMYFEDMKTLALVQWFLRRISEEQRLLEARL